jgi:cell division protein FtsN
MKKYRFILGGSALVALAAGWVVTSMLVFVAGALIGFSLRASTPVGAPARAEVAPPERDAIGDEVPSVAFRETPEDGASRAAEPEETAEPSPMEPTTEAVVVPAAVIPERPIEPAASQAASRFAIQFGAFGIRSNAEALRDRLAARGYDPVIVRAQNRSGRWLEHVRLASLVGRADASRLARRLESEGLDAIVIDMDQEGL